MKSWAARWVGTPLRTVRPGSQAKPWLCSHTAPTCTALLCLPIFTPQPTSARCCPPPSVGQLVATHEVRLGGQQPVLLHSGGLLGVVLDLRGNPGGLLDKAVAVVDLFVAQGAILSTRGRHPEASNAFDAHPGDIGEDLPVVVLVDGRSASAAEIVASALQDTGRAVVIGTNSYGKGTVQTVIALPNDGEITLTWSRFHTPSGYALHGLGVLPTICTSALPAVPPAAILDGLIRGTQSPKLPETLAVWRHTGFEETELRHRLRESCPPSRRSEDKGDMELAEKLLSNRSAFSHALALSSAPRTLETLQPRGGGEGEARQH